MDSINKILPVSAGRSDSGCLTIAGQDLEALARQYGTPLYLYDAATVQGQVQQLRDMLQQRYPGRHEITYAAKAYFSLGLAKKLAPMGVGVDVVSQGELHVARRAGFAPERVHLHGNNKSQEELEAAFHWGVQSIVVDSLEELAFLEGLAANAGKPARIWLRVSPGVAVDSHSYLQTAHHTSKFGLPTLDGQAAQAIRRARSSQWLRLTGLHTHLGSQFFDAQPYRQAVDSLMALAEETSFIPEEFSPGGGWGVPYLPNQPESSPAPWIETVSSAVVEACQKRGWRLPRLVIEPGRWLIARAAVALYSVGTTKTAGDGTRFVAVDGGMADNPRPALYQARYAACLARCPDAEPDQNVNLVGRFCESGDQLIHDLPLPEARRGDLLVVPVAGAYQLSMASNYNLSPRPAVLWLEDDGSVQVLQKREQPENTGWWVD